MATNPPAHYSESDIAVLEGLDPVRLRPGQFTRTDSPLHIVQEVLDNAIDEALAGHASLITVHLQDQTTVTISDNGRGIPVGPHPEKKIPTVEVVFSSLYSGGKFNKTSGNSAYSFSGGLHGVGVSVTNALSSQLNASIKRDGFHWTLSFQNGYIHEKLKKGPRVSPSDPNKTGTTIQITPNPSYFDNPLIPTQQLLELLQSKAVLLPKLTISWQEQDNPPQIIHYPLGLQDYITNTTQLLHDRLEPLPIEPIIDELFLTADDISPQDSSSLHPGEGASFAIAWTQADPSAWCKSFINMIPTPQHGTHVAGLKTALFSSINTYAQQSGNLPKGLRITPDDCLKNALFILSGRILDPSFDNQTKDRLASRQAVKLMEKVIGPKIMAWLNQHPPSAAALLDIIIANATARTRSQQKQEKKRTSSLVLLPGKLADCESKNPPSTELFLVEGDSAGGSAKQARNKEIQAILSLRGKPLNTWEVPPEDLFKNTEIHDIASAIGIDPHPWTASPDLSRLRYHKIAILSDADVDGFHIRVLLCALFLRHFPHLVRSGHIYIAEPPLYRLETTAQSKKKPAKKLYIMSDAELATTTAQLTKEGYKDQTIGRFKGLGEMNPEELWDTTLNPDTRVLRQLQIPHEQPSDLALTFQAMDHLLCKIHPPWRKKWLETDGHLANSRTKPTSD